MPTLTLLYLIPAGVFVAMAVLWFLAGKIPRLFSVLPVMTCYAMTAVLLIAGGMCHRVAHIKLSGLEIDLVARDGTPRPVILGSELPRAKMDASIDIPGLPPDALRLGLVNDHLTLAPGAGYHRGILVRTGGVLVPLEPGGVPRLVLLEKGDTITIPPTEGGEVIAQWRVGNEVNELVPTTKPRWIGSDGTGIAKLAGLPPQVLSVHLNGAALELTKGPGWTPNLGVMINGRRLEFEASPALQVSYFPGLTTLSLVQPDPVVGTLAFDESAPPLRREAFLSWQSVLPQPTAFEFPAESGRLLRVGGTIEDDVFVKGLPGNALTLSVSPDGKMTLDLTDDGREAQEEGLALGTFPQTVPAGQPIVLGDGNVTHSGSFHLLGPTAPPVVVADENSSEGSVNLPPPSATPPAFWRCAWQPVIKTRWQLPNRTISLPLASVPVDLFTRRPWTQRVFGLGQLSARESALQSAIVYTPDHPAMVNGASLLQLEPSLVVSRGGKPLAPPAVELGRLRNGAKLEILQVLTETQGDNVATSLGHPLHPAVVNTPQRVTVRRRFAAVTVVGEERGSKTVPVLRVAFEKPQIRSISMSDVKDELAARDDEGPQGVRFGINDRTGFSDLPHQVTFPMLTHSFDDANADVEMNWSELVVQDDFRHQTLKYGEPFKIGGSNRLDLTVTKETISTSRVFWVILTGLLATAIAWVNGASFWWMALQFGVSFLTCSRVLFGQAALVNAPYNSEVISTGMIALVLAPAIMGLGMLFLRGFLPGRLDGWLANFEARVTYRWVALAALGLLVLRIAMLGGFGAKEAVSLGGFRLALSVFFVPAYLLLFAQTCQLLWQEKELAGGLRPRVITRFAITTLWLFGCQSVTALLVSDLGMFLYFVPMALVLAAIGTGAAWEGLVRSLRVSKEELKAEKPWLASISGSALVLPLVMMMLVFTAPRFLINSWPGMLDELSSDTELVTDSTLLRVLQFANEDYLINLGTDTAERIAQDHAIMANYAHRGLFGEGYLQVDVLPAKAVTALNDNVSAVFIFAQFGVVGALAMLAAYLAMMLAGLGGREKSNALTSWLALLAGMSFALVSIYMMAANFGLLPFTGRNMYLLGLNSWSDVAESLALVLFIMLGIARSEHHDQVFTPPKENVLGDIIQGNA